MLKGYNTLRGMRQKEPTFLLTLELTTFNHVQVWPGDPLPVRNLGFWTNWHRYCLLAANCPEINLAMRK